METTSVKQQDHTHCKASLQTSSWGAASPPPEEMMATMADEDAVGDFANRLKHEFEDHESDASDMMESQDWFVNDKREDQRAPSPTMSPIKENDGTGAAGVVSPSSVASPASKATVSQATSNTVETPEVREFSTLELGLVA
jgi:hypothetical protein